MDLDTGGTLRVDQVVISSLRVGIRGGLELNWVPDPSPSSNPGGMDFADSSSKSSSLMGGVDGFAFCLVGGGVKDGGGVG